jgi:hypothetical protein
MLSRIIFAARRLFSKTGVLAVLCFLPRMLHGGSRRQAKPPAPPGRLPQARPLPQARAIFRRQANGDNRAAIWQDEFT